MNQKKLLIMGFGGHARSVADVAFACGYKELLFADSHATLGENFLGHPVLRDLNELSDNKFDAFPASGDAQQRKIQSELIENKGHNLISLISPLASIGVASTVSLGCFIGHHTHVGPMAKIGRGCIVNTGAIIEHEAVVGDYSHISVNSTIAGRSRLGAFSSLGAGGIIIDGLSVTDDVTIGAGAVVLSSVTISGTYVGIPARKIK